MDRPESGFAKQGFLRAPCVVYDRGGDPTVVPAGVVVLAEEVGGSSPPPRTNTLPG